MNLNANPTIEQFREVLADCDDAAGHHVLWVRQDGEVVLTHLPKSNPRQPPSFDDPQMRLRYGTFAVGHGYVGPEAAKDERWSCTLFAHLLTRWVRAKDTPGLTHVKLCALLPDGCPDAVIEVPPTRRKAKKAKEPPKPRPALPMTSSPTAVIDIPSQINLNGSTTMAQFRAFLESQDDRVWHHVLWVRADGQIMLSRLPREKWNRIPPTCERPEMRLRYETFPATYGYLGPKPIEEWWILGEVYGDMVRRWPTAARSLEITHVEIDEIAPSGAPKDEEALQIARFGRTW